MISKSIFRKDFGLILLHVLAYSGLAAVSDIWNDWQRLFPANVLAALLIWVSVRDFKSYSIPDLANLLLALLGLGSVYLFQPWDFGEHVLAMILWGGIFLAVIVVYRALRGFDGLGMGDAKLMGGAGALLGLHAPLSVVLAGSLSGLLYGLVIWGMKRDKSGSLYQSAIAFGPFLSVSIWGVWLFGPIF